MSEIARSVASMEVVGLAALERHLAVAPERARTLLAAAITEQANSILADSLDLVPVRDGILRSSGDVSQPILTTSGSVEVEVGYGGPAADYAVAQHENLTFQHAPGRTAKYLERPALAHAANFERDLSSRLTRLFR